MHRLDKIRQNGKWEKRLALTTLLLLPVYAYVLLRATTPSLPEKISGFDTLAVANGQARHAETEDLSAIENTRLEKLNNAWLGLRDVFELTGIKPRLIIDLGRPNIVFDQIDGIWVGRNEIGRTQEILESFVQAWAAVRGADLQTQGFYARLLVSTHFNRDHSPRPWVLLEQMPKSLGPEVQLLRSQWQAEDALPKTLGPLEKLNLVKKYSKFIISSNDRSWTAFLAQLDDSRVATHYSHTIEKASGENLVIDAMLKDGRLVNWFDRSTNTPLSDELGLRISASIPIRELRVTACFSPTSQELLTSIGQSRVAPKQVLVVQDCGQVEFQYSTRLNWPLFTLAMGERRLDKNLRVHQLPSWVLVGSLGYRNRNY